MFGKCKELHPRYMTEYFAVNGTLCSHITEACETAGMCAGKFRKLVSRGTISTLTSEQASNFSAWIEPARYSYFYVLQHRTTMKYFIGVYANTSLTEKEMFSQQHFYANARCFKKENIDDYLVRKVRRFSSLELAILYEARFGIRVCLLTNPNFLNPKISRVAARVHLMLVGEPTKRRAHTLRALANAKARGEARTIKRKLASSRELASAN